MLYLASSFNYSILLIKCSASIVEICLLYVEISETHYKHKYLFYNGTSTLSKKLEIGLL